MSFLLLFVPIDPDLPSVFLCSDQFGLLVNFVKELLSLNVVLLYKRVLFDLKCICLSLNFRALFLLLLKLLLVLCQKVLLFMVSFFHSMVLFRQISEIVFSLLSHSVRQLKIRI